MNQESIESRLANLDKMVETEDELKDLVRNLKKLYLVKKANKPSEPSYPVKPLELKPFDGNPLKWPVYRSLLQKMIINNDQIPSKERKVLLNFRSSSQ